MHNQIHSQKTKVQSTCVDDRDTTAVARTPDLLPFSPPSASCHTLRRMCEVCQQSKPVVVFINAADGKNDAKQEVICSECRQVQYYKFCVR